MLTRRLIAPLALAAGMALMTAAVFAQPNQPDKGDRKSDKDQKGGEKKGPPKADPTVEAWLKVVMEKITDPHDVVRDSARDAVISVGPPAIPALETLAEGGDAAKAEAARRLIHAIHFHHGYPMQGHDGGRDGQHHPGFNHPGMGHFGPGAWGHGFGPPDRGKGDERKGDERKGPEGKGPKDKGPDRGERKRDEQGSLNVAPMPHTASR